MRRFFGGLAVALVVLAALVVGGVVVFDGAIRDEVEHQVAVSLGGAVPFETTPEVTIEGYPFAWYAVRREFESVRVRGGGAIPVAVDADTTIAFDDVDVTLTTVVPSTDDVRAASLTGTGRLGYADLSTLAEAEVRHDGGDRLVFERQVQLFGLSFAAALSGKPALDRGAQTLTLADPEVDIAGVRLPAQATQAVIDLVAEPFGVPLPYGLRLDAVTPAADGLRVDVTGVDVVFPLR